jgi:hypothetical protein
LYPFAGITGEARVLRYWVANAECFPSISVSFDPWLKAVAIQPSFRDLKIPVPSEKVN